MDFALIVESLPDLLEGTLLTLELVAVSTVLGLLIAVPVALMRTATRRWLMAPAYAFIFFFRGTPLLLQIFLVYYGLSQFALVRESFLWAVLREPYWCAIIAFTLNTAAYTGEILRGAIQGVSRGQIEAGRSVGMSPFLLFRRIIAPQALRLALPAYSNEVILLLKGSALASTVTLLDLTGMTQNIIAITYKPIELFLLAGSIYLSLTFILSRAFMVIEFTLTGHRRPVADSKPLLARMFAKTAPKN